jgi:hypothetical protein
VLFTTVSSILNFTACSSVEAIWRRFDATFTQVYECKDIGLQLRLAKLAGALSAITDFSTVMLSATLLLRIRNNRIQRLGQSFIFGMGFL